ncbi:hypothetical protein G9A89_001768 [Geosiphon pyriformis]|nr:hypothetical protein G9A89_001768 [Geosiphon pyriformis]
MSNPWERVDIYYNLLEVQPHPENVNSQQTGINNITEKRPKTSSNICKNNFKVVTTPDTTTLEYYQSIYTHCKQRFNIPNGIEVVKKSIYQYIENCINNYLFGNYNISEVRSNLYNNLVHYLQLGTENLNSETLVTYFQELNFNIIKYCEETYLVQSQYSINFESETETSNKGKQKLKQYSKTTPNTPILPKTTAKHLQTPEQGTNFTSPRSPTRQQESLQTSSNLFDFLAENQSEHSETAANKENNSEISEEESIDSENKKDKMTAYITKIFEFNGEDIETSPQEWLNQVTKAGDANGWNVARMLRTILYFLKETADKWFENLTTLFNDWTAFRTAFLEQFTDNNTSITLQNCFRNIKQKLSESVMTYIEKFNKLLRQICQLETNNYYFDAQILDQFIAGLKDKLIKKVCPHAPEDLNSAIQHAKRYEMAIKETNHTKLINLAIRETSSAAEEKIDQLAKKVENYFINQQQQQPQRYQLPQRRNQNNFVLFSNNHNQYYPSPQQSYYQLPSPAYYSPRPQHQNNYYQPAPQPIQQQYQQPLTQYYQDFYHTALSEGRAVAQQQNFSYISITIPPARITENANLSNIFSFEFEANESPFLLSNAVANKQKAITAMYTEAEVEEKPIRLILDTQTIIVTADSMKKTPVGEIDNFPFTIDGITISVKVLVMDAPQYQAFKTQELTISYQEQHAQVSATCGTFNKHSEKALAFEFESEEKKPIIETFMALGSTLNWADETEQQYFSTNNSLETKKPVTAGWNVLYSKPEPRKQCPYILLKCKNCHKKLSSMGACISPEEKYENHTCYYCKTCHKEQWSHLIKKSGKWDNTSCLTCGDILPEECNWIDVAMREGVCDQTCQYALSISEKVKRGTPFNVAYNSALNKLYYYPHDAKMIFDLTIALINGATKEDVHQMKKTEYIEYTLELAGFDYEDEVKVYHEIAKQINIKLCKECIMLCDEQWCSECYALSIPLSSESDKYEIKFGEPEATEKIETTPIYLIKNQPASQFKYFNNNRQGIKPEKAHKIDAGYDLRYPEKDTLTLKPKSLTKINLKIALKISLKTMMRDIQETLQSSIYLLLINISGLQLVNQRELLKKNERETQSFGSTGQFTVLSTTTQQIFESNEQVCLEHNISIPNIYIPEGTKKVQVTFYNPNNYPIVLLNNLEIGIIHSNIFQQKLPQTVPNFSEIIEHSLPKINPNPSSENYYIVMEKLFRINMGQLEPQQQNQLKELIAKFADIFAKNNNDLGRTDLV